MKLTVNSNQITDVSEWQIFRILDGLQKTATGLDGIPAWFLKIGAPFFSAVIADSANLSLATGVLPSQWKRACIVPVPIIAAPICPADNRPISITPILSRIVERIVVKEYIYPSFQCSPSTLDFSDQFAFQPTASTTVALIHLLQTITNHLHTNPYVIVYAMDFSKAFDSVRHKSVLDKFAQLEIPDNIYNWIQDFFKHHSHCTKFGDEVSNFQSIMASIIQGSSIGPAAYAVTASDLRPVTQGNSMHKYADDTYLVVPASNHQSCSTEIDNLYRWAAENNLAINRRKSVEIVFVLPRSRRVGDIPPPAVNSQHHTR
jgi:Reverse transcriptase (RNA-dependent DNA polymerase)